jgi:hypothetical protein
MGAAAVAALLRRREREVVEDFRTAGALSPSTAQSYTAIGLGDSLAIKRLRNRAVIREAAPGTYYLDEGVWTAVQRTRQRVGVVAVSMLALLLLGIVLVSIKW